MSDEIICDIISDAIHNSFVTVLPDVNKMIIINTAASNIKRPITLGSEYLNIKNAVNNFVKNIAKKVSMVFDLSFNRLCTML